MLVLGFKATLVEQPDSLPVWHNLQGTVRCRASVNNPSEGPCLAEIQRSPERHVAPQSTAHHSSTSTS